MKLNELKSVLKSQTGNIQMAILWNWNTGKDMAEGSVDYIVSNYGDSNVVRISAYEDKLIISAE